MLLCPVCFYRWRASPDAVGAAKLALPLEVMPGALGSTIAPAAPSPRRKIWPDSA